MVPVFTRHKVVYRVVWGMCMMRWHCILWREDYTGGIHSVAPQGLTLMTDTCTCSVLYTSPHGLQWAVKSTQHVFNNVLYNDGIRHVIINTQ